MGSCIYLYVGGFIREVNDQQDENRQKAVANFPTDRTRNSDSCVFPEDFVGFGSPLNSYPLALDFELAERLTGSAEELSDALQEGRLVHEEVF